jgi:hypothetical protein
MDCADLDGPSRNLHSGEKGTAMSHVPFFPIDENIHRTEHFARALFWIVAAAFVIAAACLLCSCDGPGPEAARARSFEEAVDDFETPPAKIETPELKDKVKQAKAAAQSLAAYGKTLTRELHDRTIARIREWAFWIAIFAPIAGVLAGILIGIYVSPKIGAYVGGALLGIGALAWFVDFAVTHWAWTAVGAAAVAAAAVVFEVIVRKGRDVAAGAERTA